MPTARAPACAGASTAAASSTSTPTASKIDEPEVLRRIHELVIPPAWEDVWICPYPGGHIQATGLDQAGRKQYLYHPRWRARRDQAEVRGHGRLRPRAAGAARARRDRDAQRRHEPRPRARVRRAPARPRLLPRRRRGLRGHEPVLRPGDDAQEARAPARRRAAVRLPGQARQAPRAGGRRPARRRRHRAAEGAPRRRRRSCSPTRRGAGGSTSAPRTSTSTSRTRPARTSRPRTSARGARRCSPPSRWPSAARSPPRKTGRKRAIARAVKEVAHYLGNTPAVARASYIDPRVFDRYRDGVTIGRALPLVAENGDAPAIQGPIEDAVLDLLELTARSGGRLRRRRAPRRPRRASGGS